MCYVAESSGRRFPVAGRAVTVRQCLPADAAAGDRTYLGSSQGAMHAFGLTLGSFGFAMLWAFASCEGRMVRLSQRLFVSNLEPGTREDWVRKLLGFLAELHWHL